MDSDCSDPLCDYCAHRTPQRCEGSKKNHAVPSLCKKNTYVVSIWKLAQNRSTAICPLAAGWYKNHTGTIVSLTCLYTVD